MINVREPAVAGQFYPGSRENIESMIRKDLDQLEKKNLPEKINLIGGISPHAGYIYCLKHMLPLFKMIEGSYFDEVILLNPNHTGLGFPLSIDSHDSWKTPMGTVAINEYTAEFLIRRSRSSPMKIVREPLAQKREHSAEVLLPLLSYFLRDFSFAPLCMGDSSYETACYIAELLYALNTEKTATPLLLASSDFNHFALPEQGRKLDNQALEPLLNLDSRAFQKVLREKIFLSAGMVP